VTDPYSQIAQRIRGEVVEIDRVVLRGLHAWDMHRLNPAEDAFLDAAALNLHSFYSGLETIFGLITRQVDRKPPAGESWHRDLLGQMASEWPEVRPGVISQETAERLDGYMRFRHLVRNVYATNLAPDRFSDLIDTLSEVWSQTRSELLAFATFLEDVARSVAGA